MNAPHDLVSFFNFYSFKIQKDYEILSRRVREDPGTAGDQGEENWREFLECWLPDNYSIVTKGRVLNLNGEATQQWDIIILKPGYPKALLGYKHYISSGVFAVFECKITLRKEHIEQHIKRTHEFKNILKAEDIRRIKSSLDTSLQRAHGFSITHSSIHTGLLAHTTRWKKKGRKTEEIIDEEIANKDMEIVTHPRYMTDFICVPNIAAWVARRMLFSPSIKLLPNFEGIHVVNKDNPDLSTCEVTSWHRAPRSGYHVLSNRTYREGSIVQMSINPLSYLISALMEKLGHADQRLKEIADYISHVTHSGSRSVKRYWPEDIYSENEYQAVPECMLSEIY